MLDVDRGGAVREEVERSAAARDQPQRGFAASISIFKEVMQEAVSIIEERASQFVLLGLLVARLGNAVLCEHVEARFWVAKEDR